VPSPLTIVDLFAGAGGLGCGFINGKAFSVAVVNEKDPDSRHTYRKRSSYIFGGGVKRSSKETYEK